nr:hypothetical protein [uncultured Rhodopila sp.]
MVTAEIPVSQYGAKQQRIFKLTGGTYGIRHVATALQRKNPLHYSSITWT